MRLLSYSGSGRPFRVRTILAILIAFLMLGSGCSTMRRFFNPKTTTTTTKKTTTTSKTGNSSTTTTTHPKPLAVQSSGFTQSTSGSVSTGVILANPNPNQVATSVVVKLDLLNPSGAVVGSKTESISLIPQSSVVGMGSVIPLEGGARVAQVRTTIQKASYTWGKVPKITSSAAMVVQRDDGTTGVRGTASSPFPSALKNVKVFAVVFDNAGAIKGGGLTVIENLPANGTAPFEVPLSMSIPAASSAKVYFSVSDPSSILPSQLR